MQPPVGDSQGCLFDIEWNETVANVDGTGDGTVFTRGYDFNEGTNYPIVPAYSSCNSSNDFPPKCCTECLNGCWGIQRQVAMYVIPKQAMLAVPLCMPALFLSST